MLSEYVRAALHRARYEILAEDSTYYGEIPGFEGVYTKAATLEACREELREVLEEWILFRVSHNLPLPVVDGHELTIRATAGRQRMHAHHSGGVCHPGKGPGTRR